MTSYQGQLHNAKLLLVNFSQLRENNTPTYFDTLLKRNNIFKFRGIQYNVKDDEDKLDQLEMMLANQVCQLIPLAIEEKERDMDEFLERYRKQADMMKQHNQHHNTMMARVLECKLLPTPQ